jgi:hypothetical protein
VNGLEDGRAPDAVAGGDVGLRAVLDGVDEPPDRRRKGAPPLLEDLVVEEGPRAIELLLEQGVDRLGLAVEMLSMKESGMYGLEFG